MKAKKSKAGVSTCPFCMGSLREESRLNGLTILRCQNGVCRAKITKRSVK
jgi:hypothetical protein